MMYNKNTMAAERFKYLLLPFLITCFVASPLFFAYPQATDAQAATASCAASYIGSLLAPLATSLGLSSGGAATVAGGAVTQGASTVIVVPVTNVGEGTQLGGIAAQNSASNLNTSLAAAGATSQSFYTCILRPLAEAMATRILANITNNLVTWIKSGFNGNPAFVTNMGDLLSNSADQAIGSFIQSDPSLSFLCSPFAAQIRISLAVNFSSQQYQGCTLTQVDKNISAFGNSFDAWNQWLSVTTVPANNQFGAYVQESGLLQDKINSTLGNQQAQLNRSGGFLDLTTCDTWSAPQSTDPNVQLEAGLTPDEIAIMQQKGEITADSATTPTCLHYTTQTPGSVISNALAGTYSAEFNKIGVATDIDQIVGALVDELVTTTITGPGGLLGSKTPSTPIPANANISTLASQESASNAAVINELNGQAATGADVQASTTSSLLTASVTPSSSISGATATSTASAIFSNAYPASNSTLANPIALPIPFENSPLAYEVGTAISAGQTSGLQAIITIQNVAGNTITFNPEQAFASGYAFYVDQQGQQILVDGGAGGAQLLQNGTLTIQNLSATTLGFQFDTIPAFISRTISTGGRNSVQEQQALPNTYELVITIKDSNGVTLATNTAFFQIQ